MSLSVGDILKIVAVMAYTDGNIMENVFAAEIVAGSGPFDEEDVLDDMKDWIEDIYDNLTARISSYVDGSEVRVYRYDSGDDDFDEVGTTGFSWNPSGGTEELPRGVAALINAKTTDPDVNGKKYFGGFCEGFLDLGLWGSATAAALVTLTADWYTAFTGTDSAADFQPGVWSPKNKDIYPLSGTFVIPLIPAYQRRRKQWVGI